MPNTKISYEKLFTRSVRSLLLLWQGLR